MKMPYFETFAIYKIKMFIYIILSKQGAQLYTYRLNISEVSITPRWPD